MTTSQAWSLKGCRAYDTRPSQRGSNISMVGALDRDGLRALHPYDGSVDSEKFIDFIESKLKPCLKKGDVIIMDNCKIHYAKRVTEKLKQMSVQTLFMPPYSPELNPIEETWSVIKGRLKQKKARNLTDYIHGLMEAKKTITPKKARAFFKHAKSFETLC